MKEHKVSEGKLECAQEDRIKGIEEKLKEFYDNLIKLFDAQQRQSEISVGIGKDLEYIKKKLDNGITINMASMNDKLDKISTTFKKEVGEVQETVIEVNNVLISEIKPGLKDATYWAYKFREACFYIAIVAVGGGIISTLFYVAKWFIENHK